MSAAGSAARFTAETPSAGTYALQIAYANGTGAEARQSLTVNGSAAAEVVYPSTSGWFAQGKSGRVRVTATLRAGTNTIELAKGSAGSVELDAIDLSPATFRVRAEAEHARLSGGARTFTSGYASGDGYVGYIENASYVEFTVDGVPWVIVEEISAEGNGAGGGGGGGWVLLPGHDADGAAGYPANTSRWVGGMVHELGHAFGLPDSTFTDGTCMSASFCEFPSCTFTDSQKNGILNGSYGSFLH